MLFSSIFHATNHPTRITRKADKKCFFTFFTLLKWYTLNCRMIRVTKVNITNMLFIQCSLTSNPANILAFTSMHSITKERIEDYFKKCKLCTSIVDRSQVNCFKHNSFIQSTRFAYLKTKKNQHRISNIESSQYITVEWQQKKLVTTYSPYFFLKTVFNEEVFFSQMPLFLMIILKIVCYLALWAEMFFNNIQSWGLFSKILKEKKTHKFKNDTH